LGHNCSCQLQRYPLWDSNLEKDPNDRYLLFLS
jgi:hypothetical protein